MAPAARGYLTDATPPERRGEAFGLYGAVQMGGGSPRHRCYRGRAVRRDLLVRVPRVRRVAGGAPPSVCEGVRAGATHPAPSHDLTEFPPDAPSTIRRAVAAVEAERPSGAHSDPIADQDAGAPTHLLNRGLIAALVINAGGYFGGTYDVIWSLFLQRLGAGLGLIGLTFAMFGLPVLLLSPFAGRLVDRRGSLAFIVIGSILPGVDGRSPYAPRRSEAGGPADPRRGDRLRDAQPGALRRRRRELCRRVDHRRRRAFSGPPGRSGSSWRR